MVENNGQIQAKAKAFFEKAQKAVGSKNYDYAIEMYLEGLQITPDALRDGHFPLRELAVMRRNENGTKPTMMEKVKRLRGKTTLEQMINAEYLFAKDPDHLPYGEAMLKAAAAGGYKETAMWIADMVFQANNASKKPSFQTYLFLKDSYAAIGQFDRALAACRHALKIKPTDGSLADELKRLAAELTVSRGRYDQEGDFRDSIKDRESQEKRQAQQGVIKTEDYRITAIKDARDALAGEPDLARNTYNLANALTDMQTNKADNEAVELLERTYKQKNEFSFKQRAGEVRIRQYRRNIRQAKTAIEANPEDAKAKERLKQLTEQLIKTKLEHYHLCVKNYPTDMQAKYEYGLCVFKAEKYDDAIPLFQQAQRDPRRKTASMDKIGLCFFMKGWFTDAIDIFTQAIDGYEIKDDGIAKELRYNLARSYEEQKDFEKALDIYRKLAQLDFGYKDVRKRVDELRNNAN